MEGQDKILVVEDDQFMQRIYKTKLESSGFKIISAGNGKEAIEKSETETPDLILLDLVLPEISGFEVLTKLKENSKTSQIPVIILSNLGQKEDIEKGLSLGADDYLVKAMHPINAVIDKIKEQLLKGKRGKKAIVSYNIAIKESIFDGPQLARDFNFSGLFSCPNCQTQMILNLIPTKKDTPEFTAKFICPKCDNISEKSGTSIIQDQPKTDFSQESKPNEEFPN